MTFNLQETADKAVAQFNALNEREVALTKDLDTVRNERVGILGLIESLEKALNKTLIKRSKKAKKSKGKAGRTKGKGKTKAKAKGKPGRPKGTKNGSGITNLIVADLTDNGPSTVKEVIARIEDKVEQTETPIYQRVYSTITRLQKANRVRRVSRGVFEAVPETAQVVEPDETPAVTITEVIEDEPTTGLVVGGETVALLPGLLVTEVTGASITSDVAEG
jgi:hypothetical protein